MLNFINALPGAISQGLIWGIMAIGVYITYKILDIADLTVDGSFCTGAAVFVVLYTGGTNLWIAMLASLLAGMLAGLVTGILHTFCGIPAILSGILTQLGLWSINMAIMGMKATVAINVSTPELLDKLLVSLRFVQDVAKGARPFYRHPILVVGIFTAILIAILSVISETKGDAASIVTNRYLIFTFCNSYFNCITIANQCFISRVINNLFKTLIDTFCIVTTKIHLDS